MPPSQNDGGCPFPRWFAVDAVGVFDLQSSDVAVFTAIWSYANAAREAWPAQRSIAERANVSRSTAQASIDRLVRHGLLFIVSVGKGRGSSTRYAIPKRMPRPGNVRFLPQPTRTASYGTDPGWATAPQ